jgi:hypothetical protein
MMRRLSEQELLREPARRPDERADTHEPERAAALLAHVLRALATELTAEQLRALRPQLAHAIARGLRGEP